MGSPLENRNSQSTVKSTGQCVKDVKMKSFRRMMTTITRLMYMTLITNKIGMTEVEKERSKLSERQPKGVQVTLGTVDSKSTMG